MKNILIMNDFVSLGKIAGKMMDAVLSYKNHRVFFLPTSLIANNFSLGKNAIEDCTDYLKASLKNWTDLAFKFDLISIGYIHNSKQKEIISSFLESLTYKALIVFDPIMGDDGHLYKSLDESMIENYKSMIDLADIITPNATEAKFLDIDYDKLKEKGKKYLITSVKEEEKYFVKGFDTYDFKIPFKKLPKRMTGTGDLFDGLFIAFILDGFSLEEASMRSVGIISKIYEDAIKTVSDENINIERYLYLID